MRYSLRSFLIATAVLFTGISSASAEVFYWQDPETKLSVTVPDTWRLGHDQKPDDVMTFWAPGPGDFASCRMRVRQDKRFVIYPHRFQDEVTRLNYNREFWNDYIGEFDEPVLDSVTMNAGMGLGHASWAEASYVTSVGMKAEMRGLMFVSLYNDKAYILDCSAQKDVYAKWRNHFFSVLKSVNFRKVIHEFPTGHYRNFQRDGKIVIRGKRPMDLAVY